MQFKIAKFACALFYLIESLEGISGVIHLGFVVNCVFKYVKNSYFECNMTL